MLNNFLNFKHDELDKPIFRVFSSERFFQVLDEKKLTLVRPKLWDDPFENHIMNATGELDTGELFSIAYRDHFYGQCWTFTRESDAIWRIYAPNKDGIRVTTTPRKLLKSLYNHGGQFKDICCFIGKVQYWTTQELFEQLNNVEAMKAMLTDSRGAGLAQTLLFKRKPFKHENEVRIIYNSNGSCDSDIFKFSIDAIDLFDDIVFDPRMEYKEFAIQKKKVREYGYKKRIVKSNLYKIPKLKFRFNAGY